MGLLRVYYKHTLLVGHSEYENQINYIACENIVKIFIEGI